MCAGVQLNERGLRPCYVVIINIMSSAGESVDSSKDSEQTQGFLSKTDCKMNETKCIIISHLYLYGYLRIAIDCTIIYGYPIVLYQYPV